MPSPVGHHLITAAATFARVSVITIDKVPDPAWIGSTFRFSKHNEWGEFRIGKVDAGLHEIRHTPDLPDGSDKSEPIVIKVPN